MKKIIGLSILYIAFSFSAVSANDALPLFKKSFKNTHLTSYKDWAVTITSTEDEETKVERIDYSKTGDSRWQLLSLDGEKPSKRKTKKYLKGKRKEQKALFKHLEKNNEELAVQYLVNKSVVPQAKPDTVTLFKQTDTHSIFHFRPLMEDKESKEMETHLYGEMVVDTNSEQVEKIRLFSKETFSMQGAKISQFDQTMMFTNASTNISENNLAFLESVQVIMKGNAMGLFSLDQITTIDFSDYQKQQTASN